MEFRDSAADAAWRDTVRRFVEENVDGERLRNLYDDVGFGGWDAGSAWRQKMAARGWLAPAWPREFGGAGMSVREQFILNEELARARAPQVGGVAVALVGSTLIVHGTDEQKRRFLPAILSGATVWCQGFSEPEAGSDLASLRTRAVRDGDDYVVDGQKIWTTMAHMASWCILLVRTNPTAPKHRGISMLLVEMQSPGVSVRPLLNMANEHELNEVFFEHVRVPARNRVADENRGWYAAATTLDFERSDVTHAVAHLQAADELVRYAREHGVPAAPRRALADRCVEAEVARLFAYRVISIQAAGRVPNHEASINKLFASELEQRIMNTALKVIGLAALIDDAADDRAALSAVYTRHYMLSVPATIAAGSSEVQRNVIATRGLGLPRQ